MNLHHIVRYFTAMAGQWPRAESIDVGLRYAARLVGVCLLNVMDLLSTNNAIASRQR